MAAEELVRETYPVSQDAQPARTFLGGMRLGSRVSLFVLFGLIAIVAMGALFFIADQRLSAGIQGLKSSQSVSRLVTQADSATRAVENSSRNFMAVQNDGLQKDYDQKAAQAIAALKRLRALPVAVDSIRIVDNLTDGLDQHTVHFKNILKIQSLLGSDSNSGLAGNARVSGAELETKITTSGDAKLIARGTELRDIETALRSGVSPDDPQKIRIALGALRQILAASSLSPADKLSITQSINSYAADIDQLARTRLTQANEISRISEINAYVIPNLNSLVNFAGNLGLTSQQSAEAARIFARRILAGGGAAILIFLTLVGALLIRSISSPVGDLARAATQLAHGNQAVSIPALGNFDETGEVANALTYFRENMVQADRLRKELEDHLQEAEKKAETEKAAAEQASEAKIQEQAAQIQIADDLQKAEPARQTPDIPGRDLVPLPPEPGSKNPISDISQLVSLTSHSASESAKDAERAEMIVNGLSDSLEKVNDIELLLASVSDQMSLLAVQTALSDEADPEDQENLILLSEKRLGEEAPARPLGQSIGDRIDTIQSGTKKAIKAVQQIGRTMTEVNGVALEFAAEASNEALKAATALLHQSEDLRGMLDDLLGKIKPDGKSEAK